MNMGTTIRSLATTAIVVAASMSLAACSSSAGGTSAPSVAPIDVAPAPVSIAPIDTPSAEPSMSDAASSPEASTAEATAVPTAIDPCGIVTAAEVSKLTGANFSSGQAATAKNNVKTCSYGQEGVDFTVTAAVAPDVATAKKNEADFKAELEKNAPGFPYKLTELPNFAPGADAAIIDGSMKTGGGTYTGIAIYVLRNTTFFAITDISSLGGAAPTPAQMEDQAKTTLGRVP